MRWKAAVLIVVLVFGFLSVVPTQNIAQAEQIVSVDLFYQELSPYGQWNPHPEFGYVWQPYEVGPQWKPYTDGRWEWSDQGWLWISYEPWGWATYHYGRWVYDDYAGWIWIPGTTWAPAWVSWQESPEYIGWSPLPPDRAFFVEIGFVFNSYKPYYKPYRHKHRYKKHRYYHDYYDNPHYYKPPKKHCVYMPYHKFGDHKHVVSELVPPKYAIDLRNSKHVTNIKRVNNKVYNYGPDKYAIETRSKKKLVRHKIKDNYAIQLRDKQNIYHKNGKSYKVNRPKIDRVSKDPYTTNRSSVKKGTQYKGQHNSYSNITTRKQGYVDASKSYKAKTKSGQRSGYKEYEYKTRQQKYNTNKPTKNIHNVKSNKAQSKSLNTVNRNAQKPVQYNKSRKLDSHKYKSITKRNSYSNNQKKYSIKNRSTQQQSYNSRSGNTPTSQKNRFSRYR